MTYGDIPPSVEGSTEGTARGCCRPQGVSPRLIPIQGRNNPCARARTKVFALLFMRRKAPIRMREAPLGMLVTYTHITPRDDCPYGKSNANTFVRARAHGLFLPRLIPPHSVEYPHMSLASLKYCYIAFIPMESSFSPISALLQRSPAVINQQIQHLKSRSMHAA